MSATEIRQLAHPITGAAADHDDLLDTLGRARFVLLGEGSHGTHQFYRERAGLTARLIEEKGFSAVAIEGDFPEALRVHRYIRGESDDPDAVEALGDFQRFPNWMWRNADVLDFIGWLRAYNERVRPSGQRGAGFFGLDLYSLHRSIAAVVAYLERVDPEGAKRARLRYGCFDHFGSDPAHYGLMTSLHVAPSCQDACVRQLEELRERRGEFVGNALGRATDEHFFAEQNARLAANAEAYYRAMFGRRASTWNLRDTHMADTLDALAAHLGPDAKIVVWAHNSHVGDARAAQMAESGELSLGQLVRIRHVGEVRSVGFTTFTGTVTAASAWGEPAERKQVRPGRDDSWEALFHAVGVPRFWLDCRAAERFLREDRLERAIGVIYLPETERMSHYFASAIAERFDTVIHVDETRAVEPLERTVVWEEGELPETWPSAL